MLRYTFTSVVSKRLALHKNCAQWAAFHMRGVDRGSAFLKGLRTSAGREGVYTSIAMERVQKRLKIQGLRAPIAQKSPETIGKKGVE